MRLEHAGVGVDLPTGWEARARTQAPSVPGATGNLLLHAATVPLPATRGDFGSGVVETLGPDDVFVALFEYDPVDAAKALFAETGLPVPSPSDFSTAVLQRTQLDHSGAQFFFQASGRPFCLHVVLGSHSRRSAGAATVGRLLAATTVKDRP